MYVLLFSQPAHHGVEKLSQGAFVLVALHHTILVDVSARMLTDRAANALALAIA
jgi:hypothetical protein